MGAEGLFILPRSFCLQVMTELDRIMGKRGLQKEAGGNWATLDLIAEFKGVLTSN